MKFTPIRRGVYWVVAGLMLAGAIGACYAAVEMQSLKGESPSYLKVTSQDGKYSVDAQDVSLKDVLRALRSESSVDFQIDDRMKGRVTTNLSGKSLEQVLKALTGSQAFVYEKVGDEYKMVSAALTTEDDPVNMPETEVVRQTVAEAEELAARGMLCNSDLSIKTLAKGGRRAILLQNAIIDARALINDGRNVDIPEEYRADPDTEYYIVEFNNPVGDEQRKMLAEAGAAISHYVPNYSFAVHCLPEKVADLKGLPGVLHVEPYHPYFKMSSDIVRTLVGDPTPQSIVRTESGKYNLMSFRTVNNLAETLGQAGIAVIKEGDTAGRQVVTVECKPAQIAELIRMDEVQWIEPKVELHPMNDLGVRQTRAPALKALHPDLTGAGVVVAVTDSGIDFRNPGFAIDQSLPTSTNMNTRIVYYDHRAGYTSDGVPGDNNGHGTHVSGSILGNGALSDTVVSSPGSYGPYKSNQFAGVATEASLVMIEDFNSFSFEEQAQTAYNQGARLGNNSWGASVYEYNSYSAEWDELVRDADPNTAGNQEFTAFFSAGNDGGADVYDGSGGYSGTIGSPGNAKNVITVGALEQPRLANNLQNIYFSSGEGSNEETRVLESIKWTDSDWEVANYSSRGPVSQTDARVKPDVVTPGSYMLSVQSHETHPETLIYEGLTRDYRYGNVNSGTNFAFFSGTSMSCPLATGAGALLFQWYTNSYGKVPSPAMMKAMMINGASLLNTRLYALSDIGSLTAVFQGWGVVNVEQAVEGPRARPTDEVILVDQDETSPLSTGAHYSRQVVVNPGEGGLKVTLAWTDKPGTPGNAIQLVNDLNLVVKGPSGVVYQGNYFNYANSWNVGTANAIWDYLNNVETVIVGRELPGTYTIEVWGWDVADGPQDFALSIIKGIGEQQIPPARQVAIDMDDNGNPVVAISSLIVGHDEAAENPAGLQIYVQRWDGAPDTAGDVGHWRQLKGQWFGYQNSDRYYGVSGSMEASTDPSVAVDGDKVYVGWIESPRQPIETNFHVYFRAWENETWQEYGNSANGSGLNGSMDFNATDVVVRVDGDGRPVVAWLQDTTTMGRRVFFYRWNGTSWEGSNGGSSPTMVNGGSGIKVAMDLTMAVDGSGRPVVAWTESTESHIEVRRLSGTTWSSLPDVGLSPYADQPNLSCGADGNLYIAWRQLSISPGSYWGNQIFAARYSGGWQGIGGSASWPGASAIVPTTGDQEPREPRIGAGENGDVAVSWIGGVSNYNGLLCKKWLAVSEEWISPMGSGEAPGIYIQSGTFRSMDMGVDAVGLPVVIGARQFTFAGDPVNELRVFSLAGDGNPPEFDGLERAIGSTNANVFLYWTNAIDDLAQDIIYHVYRGSQTFPCGTIPTCTVDDVFSHEIAVVTNVTMYEDTGLTPGLTYCFGVRAADTNGLMETNMIIRSASPVQTFGDSDGDCLSNLVEFAVGTDSCNPDTDGDGMWDGWEWYYSTNNPAHSASFSLDPLDNGVYNLATGRAGEEDQLPSADPDNDGVTSLEEYEWYVAYTNECLTWTTNLLSPDPSDPDTDADGMDDGWEIVNNLNPVDPADALLDTDGDGLTNIDEFVWGSDPLSTDSDSDGLTDGEEGNVFFTDPSLPDTDLDGLTDFDEVNIYGSDPIDADSSDNGVSDGDMYQLGYSAGAVTPVREVLLYETFETTSRTNWSHYAPNAVLPFDLWHLSTVDLASNSTDVVYMNDHTYDTSYRFANDPSGANSNATYNLGPSLQAALSSPAVDALLVENLFVEWKEYYHTEPNADFVRLQVRGGGSSNWVTVGEAHSGKSGTSDPEQVEPARWVTRTADISDFAMMNNVQVRFLFSANAENNEFPGWFVDDVMIFGGGKVSGWVRNDDGQPLEGATVWALGRGGVLETTNGMSYLRPGKIFGRATTADDGSYSISGLPAGRFYVKAFSVGYMAEFFDGDLLSGDYLFGNGLYPGVKNLDQVTDARGWVDMTTLGSSQTCQFELEPGQGRSYLAMSMFNTAAVSYAVFADGLDPNLRVRLWDGVANTNYQYSDFPTYQTTTGMIADYNHPDWLTNTVAPNMLGDLDAGVHHMYLSGLDYYYPLLKVDLREGEQVQVRVNTNQSIGYLDVSVDNDANLPIWLDGRNTGLQTPERITVPAGDHLVMLVPTGSAYFVAQKFITVPMGDLIRVEFSEDEIGYAEGATALSIVDLYGNQVTDVDIYLNGGYFGSVTSQTAEALLTGLYPGKHRIAVRRDGYMTPPIEAIQIEGGVTNSVQIKLYPADEDYDRVGDNIEVDGYTNIALYARDDDPDSDGLNNLLEFTQYRVHNILLNVFNPDTDQDLMLDGQEVGFDGYNDRLALSVLETNAVEDGTQIRAIFSGQYLAGEDDFGSAPLAAAVECDRFESSLLSYPIDTNMPSVRPMVTVFTNIPPETVPQAISEGHNMGARILADAMPDEVDTDGDGMWDGFEYMYRTNLEGDEIMSPIACGGMDGDADHDGLSNIEEFLGTDGMANTNDSTNPLKSDTDGDGLPDGWEYFYGYDPNDPADAFFDEDGDSLVTLSEYYAGTNPQLADTDADGLPDNEEVLTYMTDPLDLDTDNDGLLDGREVWDKDLDGVRDGGFFPMWNHGDLDNDGYVDGPTDWDTDGDGMPDGFEVIDYLGNLRDDPRLDPYNPYDGDDDPDGDGLTSLEEYLVRDALFGNNKAEVVWDYSSDPFNADSDGDGLPDGWEVMKGLHPMDPIQIGPNTTSTRHSSLGPSGDLDGDGLANGREFAIRFMLDGNADSNTIDSLSTDPWNPDTDGDGLEDGEEDRSMRSHPIRQDTDADGLFDGLVYADEGKMSEVGSSDQQIISYYRVVIVSNEPITWDAAYKAARIFNTNFPGVEGHLATFETFYTNFVLSGSAPGGADQYTNLYLPTDRTNVALGGINYSAKRTSAVVWAQTDINDLPVAFTNTYVWQWLTNSLIPDYVTQESYANFFATTNLFDLVWTNLSLTNCMIMPFDYQVPYMDIPIPLNTNSSVNYMGLNPDGTVTALVSDALFDAYVIEWDVPTVQTTTYDRAMNDIWRLVWPSDPPDYLPHWEPVQIDTNSGSSQPLPRWGAGMTYIPVLETKNPRNDDADPSGGKATMLMDNRKLVVIGGRDGVTRRPDIWEFLIRSNMWVKSILELDDLIPGWPTGNSEIETIPFFGYRNTADCNCEEVPATCTGNGFAEPKNRPWEDSRSFDWSYVFGGWSGAHDYKGSYWFYKSTDSFDGIHESNECSDYAEGVLTETDANGTETTHQTFDDISIFGAQVMPIGVFNYVFTEDAKTNVYMGTNGFHFAEMHGLGRCEELLHADFVLDFYTETTGSISLALVGELSAGSEETRFMGTSPAGYEQDTSDNYPPSHRLTSRGWPYNTSMTNFVVPAGVKGYTQDVTKLVLEMINNSDVGWYGNAAGFVMWPTTDTNALGLLKNNRTRLDVEYKGGFASDPFWETPSSLTYINTSTTWDERKSAGVAYDRGRDRVVVFGGMNAEHIFGDTHEGIFSFKASSYAPDNITWEKIDSVYSPCPRWGHSMVYDAVNERIIMFGGFDENHEPLNDLWAYYGPHTVTSVETNMDGTNSVVSTNSTAVGANWVALTDFQNPERPQPRGGASMVYWGDYDYSRAIEDYCVGGNHQKIVMFGGTDGKRYFNDLWVYDPTYKSCGADNAGRWILVNPDGEKALYSGGAVVEGPGPRAFASMTWAQNGKVSPDVVGYGGYTWHTDPPSPCTIPCLYLFGGRTGPIPTGQDSDSDMVNDGLEHELGGPGAGRDPRLNAFVEIHTNEKLPYVFQRIGPVPTTVPVTTNRTAIANMETLRNDDGGYAAGYGLPYQYAPDDYQCVSWSSVAWNQGVGAQESDQRQLWYHRYTVEDPFDSRDEWELGVPDNAAAGTNAAPRYAHSGRWCYGTDLDGLYPNDAHMELYSPLLDLTLPPDNATSADNPNSWVLVYYEWLDLADSNDVVTLDAVRPVTAADKNTRVTGVDKPVIPLIPERNNAHNSTGCWRRVIVPLDGIPNEPNVYLRFALQSDSNNVAGGWYVDDIAIIQASYLSGTLTNVGAGVPVALFGANSEVPIETTLTDENGFFQFGMLPLGDYYLGSGSGVFGDISISNYVGNVGVETNVAPLEITNIDGGGTDPYEVSWPAVIGMQYRIEYVENLMDGWTPLAVVTADSNPMTYYDHQAGQSVRFYRVVPYAAP